MSVEDGIPEEGQATEPTQDWEKDYKALQAEYTRNRQTLTSFESDPNALLSFIQEKHPDLLVEDAEEEEPEDLYEEAPHPTAAELAQTRKELAELKAWQQTQVASQGKALFEKDLGEVAGDRPISKQGRDWIELQVSRGTNDRAALEAAMQEWLTYEDGLRNPPKPKPKPRAPGVIANGQAVTGGKPYSEMTREEALAAQLERAMQLDTQT